MSRDPAQAVRFQFRWANSFVHDSSVPVWQGHGAQI